MPKKLLVPIYLPGWMHQTVVKLKRRLIPPTTISTSPVKNIWGERYVEWSFLSKEMPDGPGQAIEFGCEQGYMSLLAAQKGHHVLANDLQEQNFSWKHSNVEFRAGDFLRLNLPNDYFDIAINCSSVEHVGIAGRYGITAEQSDGDIEVMQKLAEVLKPGGVLLMTAPCGRDAVMAPWCRVYGAMRLPRLLKAFEIAKEVYWVKDSSNRWLSCTREAALDFEPRKDPSDGHGCSYALGCFVLRKGRALEVRSRV
jgi:SAM-dependent methyltransferase